MVRNRRRTLALALGALVVAVAIGATTSRKLRIQRARAVTRADLAFGIERADVPAPPVAVQLADGRPLTTADLRGRVVLVNFWATWCPPCRDEMPSMLQLGRELSQKYPGRFEMLAVSVDDGWSDVLQFFQGKLPSEATVTLDHDLVATRAYYCAARGGCPDSFKFPETYLVDRSGKLVAYVVGPRDWSDPAARRLLERLIEE